MQHISENKKNENILVSIITPVYNTKDYLKKSVDSVLNQSYKNFEYILVDDGSTDGSGELCDKYAAIDSRIKVIHQRNGGAAVAKNTGIDASVGSYVCFLDSDDWFSENAIEVLVDLIKDDSVDIGMIKDVVVFDDNGNFESKDDCEFLSSEECMERTLKDLLNFVQPCNKIYKRKLVEELKFPKGIANDDMFISVERYAQIKKLAFSKKACMFYRMRTSSVTHKPFSLKDLQYHMVLEHVSNMFLKYNRKDLFFENSNKLMNSYMNYCVRLKNSGIEPKNHIIAQIRLKAKKLFKSIPLIHWKAYVIKRYFIFILSVDLYKHLIYKEESYRKERLIE